MSGSSLCSDRLSADNALVLVVDDDAMSRTLVASVARMCGYQCIEADNGERGLQMAIEALPDVLILDVHMPVMTGIEVSARLRRRPETARIPTLIFSANSDVKTRTAAFESGAMQFAEKPLDGNELKVRIKTLLGLSERRCGDSRINPAAP